MKATVAEGQSSREVNSLDRLRPKPAKASLPVNATQSLLTAVVKHGLIKACGSLKAAAIAMEMDGGQLSRDLESGSFQLKRLERLSEAEKATVVAELSSEFITAQDPRAYVLRTMREIEERLETVRQFIEAVA